MTNPFVRGKTSGAAGLMFCAVLFLAASLAGCHHHCRQPHCGREIKLTPELEKSRADAQNQLNVARQTRKWTEQDQRTFGDRLKHLPQADDYQLSRQLAVMISTSQVEVQPGQQAPERETCCCVAGACKPTAP